MKLDFLFGRHHPGSSWRDRHDPRIAPIADDLLPLTTTLFADERETAPLALPPPRLGIAVRQMSPRQLAEWAHDMYVGGALTWAEYRLAGFPAELHPEYNRTVGALTGRPATPDRPRDMVREWEDMLAFYHRHNTPQDPQIKRVEKVLSLLCSHGGASAGGGMMGASAARRRRGL